MGAEITDDRLFINWANIVLYLITPIPIRDVREKILNKGAGHRGRGVADPPRSPSPSRSPNGSFSCRRYLFRSKNLPGRLFIRLFAGHEGEAAPSIRGLRWLILRNGGASLRFRRTRISTAVREDGASGGWGTVRSEHEG